VSRVDFYIDGVLKLSDTEIPYEYSWNTAGVSVGSHTIKAKAVDSDGAVGEDSVGVEIMPDPNMVLVEGGTFQMGDVYNIQIHTVTLSSFYIGKFEVTQSEWIATMGSNPSHFTGDLNLPVDAASWCNVLIYCNKRSFNENLTPCYSINGSTDPADWPDPVNDPNSFAATICNWSANGYRMPTEAEWEFAARGGNSSQGYTYSGSNVCETVAWTDINSYNKTHPVGEKLPNELGLYDMSGNVGEWNWDWYGGEYQGYSVTNPHGATVPLGDGNRIFRGGSFNNIATYCGVAYRDKRSPVYGNGGWYYGFRVVRINLQK